MDITQPKIITGIDLGNSSIRVAIGKTCEDGVEIIGIGLCPSQGLIKFLSNPEAAATAIRSAIDAAELMAGCKVENAIVGILNLTACSQYAHANVLLKEGKVGEQDYLKAIESVQSIPIAPESQILHTIPLEFVIDNNTRTSQPLGLTGSSLEINAHIITIGSDYMSKVLEACDLSGLSETRIILQALAVAETELFQDEREKGVLHIDFGASHLKMALFSKGVLQFYKSIGVAGNQLTSDVAISLRIKMAHAENVKRLYGCCFESMSDCSNTIEVLGYKGKVLIVTSQKVLAEILGPRVEEMLLIMARYLKQAGFGNELPAGVVITGGTSSMLGMKELAMQQFNMPVRIGSPITINGVLDKISQPQHSTAVGLVMLGAKEFRQTAINNHSKIPFT